MEIAQKAFDESLIPLMQSENALVNRYNKLIATAKIDWEGEELKLFPVASVYDEQGSRGTPPCVEEIQRIF